MQFLGTTKTPRPWPALALAIVVGWLALPAVAQEEADPAAADDALAAPELKRPDWGKVRGWVLDAETREPIAGARVQIEVGGQFADDGRTLDHTRADGRYEAKAPLGAISSRFDWTRLLSLTPLSILGGPSGFSKQTRVLDVTRLNLRVTADGYRPFLGTVRAEHLQPGKFRVVMTDVWLARAGGKLASFNPSNVRMESFESLTLDPPVAAPGDTVVATLVTELPVDRDYTYRAFLTSSSPRLLDDNQQLKQDKSRSSGRRVVFEKTIKTPKKTRESSAEIGFYLIRDGDTLLRQARTGVLLQVVESEQHRAAAVQVHEGYLAMRDGRHRQALAAFSEARRLAPRYALAHSLAGRAALRVNQPEAAVDAFAALVRLDPTDFREARPRYAEALVAAGQLKRAEAELAAVEQALPKSAPRPPLVHVLRARIAAAKGDFASVDRDLTAAGQQTRIDDEVVRSIRIIRTQRAVQDAPEIASMRMPVSRKAVTKTSPR